MTVAWGSRTSTLEKKSMRVVFLKSMNSEAWQQEERLRLENSLNLELLKRAGKLRVKSSPDGVAWQEGRQKFENLKKVVKQLQDRVRLEALSTVVMQLELRLETPNSGVLKQEEV